LNENVANCDRLHRLSDRAPDRGYVVTWFLPRSGEARIPGKFHCIQFDIQL